MRSIWITMQNCASREINWLSVNVRIRVGAMFHAQVEPDFRFGQRAKIIKIDEHGNSIGEDNAVIYTTEAIVGEEI